MIDELLGTRPGAVLDLLMARRAQSRNGGVERGTRKLALIVEGGGMRGVLSAGSLLALDLLGFRYCFDEIYATSAGAVNAAYFVAEQGRMGMTVYFDCINNRRFYNPFRLTKIVDVGFVYDHVVPHVKTLDEKRIRTSPTDLFFSLTDVSTGDNVLLNVKECGETVAKMLKASSALPILYNRTVLLEGRKFVDGGVTCTLPIQQAVARGCTDVLILLTKTRGYELPPPNFFDRALLYAMMGHRFPRLMDAYEKMAANTNQARRIAVGDLSLDGVNVATICPNEAELIVGRTTIERGRLIEGARLLASKTFRLFGEDAAAADEIFEEYRRSGSC